MKRNFTRGRGRGLLCVPTWYRKLSPVPGLSRKLSGRRAVSFTGEAFTGVDTAGKKFLMNPPSSPGRGNPLCAVHACITETFLYHHGNSLYMSILKRPELLCGKLWFKLGWAYVLVWREECSHQQSPSCLRLACSWGTNVYT